MRVGVVHSFYQSGTPSGENVAVAQHVAALERAGIEVVLFARRTDEMQTSPFYGVTAAARVATGIDVRAPNDAIRVAELDVLHIHNLFPNFGTHWLAKIDTPIVSTVHNFRSVCANGLLLRDGRVCTDCLTKGSHSAVIHSCYRESRLASLPLAVATRGGAARNPLFRHSRQVILQSERALRTLEQAGLPPGKASLLPGFVERVHEHATGVPPAPRYAFVGRFSPEKGLGRLLASWPSSAPLDVIGSGDPTLVRSFSSDGRFTFLGEMEPARVRALLPQYTGLVFPGLCPEGAYPLVVREALEAGVPVAALEGSSAADLVSETSAGAVFGSDFAASLAAALERLEQGGEGLRIAARTVFEKSLTEEVWTSRLLTIYRDAINGRASRSRR